MGSSSRPDWTQMRPHDFDTTAAWTLFDIPAPVVSTGDDLISLLTPEGTHR